MSSSSYETHPSHQHPQSKTAWQYSIGPLGWSLPMKEHFHPLSWSQAFLDLFRQEGTGEMAVLTGIVQHERDRNGSVTWAQKGAAPAVPVALLLGGIDEI